MKLGVFDATRKPSLMEEGWGAGMLSMWLRERLDGMLGAVSWEEVLEWFRVRSQNGKMIDEVQFWGHGQPGDALLNSKRFSKLLKNESSLVHDLHKFLSDDALFWFRTCSTFQGKAGLEFSQEVAETLRCRVAGHTFKIGALGHSGLHTLEPGAVPTWDENEGRKKNGKSKMSLPWKTHTIMFCRSTIPKGW